MKRVGAGFDGKFVQDCYFRLGSEEEFGLKKEGDGVKSQLLKNLSRKEFKSSKNKVGSVMIRPTGIWTKVTNFYNDDFYGTLETAVKRMNLQV